MNVNNNLPIRIQDWFRSRGITDRILEENEIGWSDKTNEIVIPIFNTTKDVVFNKRRRDPLVTDGPKYRYDSGAEMALYGIHQRLDSPIFITEGELDALLLQSLGMCAVSSTGGAQSFHHEWRNYFQGLDTYICFDNDEAGMEGMIKVQSIIPHAKVLIVPQEESVKDVTDYFKKHTVNEWIQLMEEARTYPIPIAPSGIPRSLSLIRGGITELNQASNGTLEIQRELRGQGKDTRLTERILDKIANRLDFFQRQLKSFKQHGPRSDRASSDIIRAKEEPIPRFIQFQPNGFAKCIWHTEKTASMKYNDTRYEKYPNTLKCFSCGARGDVIDVVMQLYNVEFQAAINLILGKNEQEK